jgi:crotonobetainyl-CoA:carnitine CoA-transferase CaiB-like acyl-CoA transferase
MAHPLRAFGDIHHRPDDAALVGCPKRSPRRHDLREALAAAFRRKTRDEWCRLLEGSDSCFAPVLTLTEARAHPHIRARSGFVEVDGVHHTAPAPRFSRTPLRVRGPAPAAAVSVKEILDLWDCTEPPVFLPAPFEGDCHQDA